MNDEGSRLKNLSHEVGMDLDALSIDELKLRIDLLGAEIARLEKEIENKSLSLATAENAFKI
jgi:uncharacterized small protein (DUF1192 family)